MVVMANIFGQGAPPRWATLADVPRNRTLFVSFTNGHYSDMMLNWVEHLKRMQAS